MSKLRMMWMAVMTTGLTIGLATGVVAQAEPSATPTAEPAAGTVAPSLEPATLLAPPEVEGLDWGETSVRSGAEDPGRSR